MLRTPEIVPLFGLPEESSGKETTTLFKNFFIHYKETAMILYQQVGIILSSIYLAFCLILCCNRLYESCFSHEHVGLISVVPSNNNNNDLEICSPSSSPQEQSLVQQET